MNGKLHDEDREFYNWMEDLLRKEGVRKMTVLA